MLAVTVAVDLTLAGCTERPASSAASLPQSAAVEPAAERDAGFVNRVWQVRASSAGDPGAFYVFLADGTLLIASSHGTPMIGSWKQEKEGVLTMVEEGIPYRVEVLKFAPGELRLRSHNPGQPVEMTLVPAGPGAPPARPDTAASPAPHADLEQRYVPLSRVTETWGMLRLSRTSAQIAAFAGSMRLEHAGVMSTSAGSDLAGAEVFRIVNAEDYFARNEGRNAFCAGGLYAPEAGTG